MGGEGNEVLNKTPIYKTYVQCMYGKYHIGKIMNIYIRRIDASTKIHKDFTEMQRNIKVKLILMKKMWQTATNSIKVPVEYDL